MSAAKKFYLGMDEAGRGSVVGPLVMGAVLIDQSTLEYYNETEITDSKQLSAEKRSELYEIIKKTSLSHSAIIISPTEIDKAVLSPTTNLNMLELETMTKLILDNPESTDIFIDAISKPDYCTDNLKSLLKKEKSMISIKKSSEDVLHLSRVINEITHHATVIAQNKADLNYKVVSASSIIAKVTRDLAIRSLENEYNLEEGILASGYPNEQLKPFLQKYKTQIKKKEFPFIRYSWDWAPLKTLITTDKMKQTKLF